MCRLSEVAMLHDSLSLGPPLRFGLPPYGRHHFAALMRITPVLHNKNQAPIDYSQQGAFHFVENGYNLFKTLNPFR